MQESARTVLQELCEGREAAGGEGCSSWRKDSCSLLKGPLELHRQYHNIKMKASEAMQAPAAC